MSCLIMHCGSQYCLSATSMQSSSSLSPKKVRWRWNSWLSLTIGTTPSFGLQIWVRFYTRHWYDQIHKGSSLRALEILRLSQLLVFGLCGLMSCERRRDTNTRARKKRDKSLNSAGVARSSLAPKARYRRKALLLDRCSQRPCCCFLRWMFKWYNKWCSNSFAFEIFEILWVSCSNRFRPQVLQEDSTLRELNRVFSDWQTTTRCVRISSFIFACFESWLLSLTEVELTSTLLCKGQLWDYHHLCRQD